MLLVTLGASLLGNLLTGKGTIRAGEGAIATSRGRVQWQHVKIFNAAPSFD